MSKSRGSSDLFVFFFGSSVGLQSQSRALCGRGRPPSVVRPRTLHVTPRLGTSCPRQKESERKMWDVTSTHSTRSPNSNLPPCFKVFFHFCLYMFFSLFRFYDPMVFVLSFVYFLIFTLVSSTLFFLFFQFFLSNFSFCHCFQFIFHVFLFSSCFSCFCPHQAFFSGGAGCASGRCALGGVCSGWVCLPPKMPRFASCSAI